MLAAHDADPHVQSLRAARGAAHREKAELVYQALKAGTAKEGEAKMREAKAAEQKAQEAEEALAHESRRSFRASFGTRPEDQPALTSQTFDRGGRKDREADWKEASDFLQGVSTKEAIGDHKINLLEAKDGRAFYQPITQNLGRISAAKDSGPAVNVHEFGHHLEETPAIRDRVQAFSRERFGNEAFKDMAQVAPDHGYEPGKEMGRADQMEKVFGSREQAYYAGKEYSDGRTEVLSMGLEQLYRDPVHLARKDPQYFALVVGALQRKG